MPALDRRITIEQNHGTVNSAGELVDDWRTFDSVWATRMDRGVQDTPFEGGEIVIATRGFTVRWRSDLVALDPTVLRIVEGGQTFAVANVLEDPGRNAPRRRFLRLEVIG